MGDYDGSRKGLESISIPGRKFANYWLDILLCPSAQVFVVLMSSLSVLNKISRRFCINQIQIVRQEFFSQLFFLLIFGCNSLGSSLSVKESDTCPSG